MITVTVIGREEVVAKLKNLPEKLRRILMIRMDAFLIKVQTYVKTQKLHGQVLNQRTGKLSDSISYDKQESQSGVVGRVFSAKGLHYAGVHEYGGTFTIPEHQRLISKVWGEPVEPHYITVKSYTAVYPERSYLRSSLKDKHGEFLAMVTKTVGEVK